MSGPNLNELREDLLEDYKEYLNEEGDGRLAAPIYYLYKISDCTSPWVKALIRGDLDLTRANIEEAAADDITMTTLFWTSIANGWSVLLEMQDLYIARKNELLGIK